jgi:hypothetical protein
MENNNIYVVATIHIPIRVLNGGNTMEPLQSRCQIEFRQCANLDDYPENHSLETQTLMNKFTQFLSPPTVVKVPDPQPDVPQEVQQETDLQPDVPQEVQQETDPQPEVTQEVPQEVTEEESPPTQTQKTKIIEISPKPRSKQKTFRIYNNDGSKKTRFTLRTTPK